MSTIQRLKKSVAASVHRLIYETFGVHLSSSSHYHSHPEVHR